MTWRWPWVSRATLNEERQSRYNDSLNGYAALQRQREESSVVISGWQTRYDNLLARYHMLKIQGAVVVEPTAPREIPKPDIVKAAIALASRGNPDLARQMEVAAEKDRAANLTDEQIVRRIKAGTRVQSEFEIPTTPTPSGDASVS